MASVARHPPPQALRGCPGHMGAAGLGGRDGDWCGCRGQRAEGPAELGPTPEAPLVVEGRGAQPAGLSQGGAGR